MAPDSPVLVVRGVHKSFDDGTAVRAVRGASLSLGPAEFAVIVGPSGCGKTTLFSLIAGIERPDEGEIVVGGLAVTGCSTGALVELRRRHVGLVDGDHRLLAGLSLLENVALAATVAGERRDTAEGRAHELLDAMDLGDAWRSLPAQVGPAQRQRAALARAVVNRPALLLADEPTSRLDSAGQRDLLDLLVRLHDAGQSILLATHDGEVAASAVTASAVAASAARIIAMRDGFVDEPTAPHLLPAGDVAVPSTEAAGHGRVVL